MLNPLGTATLKDGVDLEIARLDTPDLEWAERVAPFLSQRPPWKWQIAQTLRTETSPLEAYYYLGMIDDELVGSICTFEYGGVGVLGHVFTAPSQRRLGVCRSIMSIQMQDFRSRKGRAIYLATGFDSPAYHIYSSFGFRSLSPESGEMENYSDGVDAFENEQFSAGDAFARPSEWRDWAGSSALFCQRSGSPLRSVYLQLYGRHTMELGYLLLRLIEEDLDQTRTFALESRKNGATVGYVSVVPDPRFPGVDLCDLFVHPEYSGYETELASCVADLPGKTQAYSEIGDLAKIAALKSIGFRTVTRLPEQMIYNEEPLDLVLLSN